MVAAILLVALAVGMIGSHRLGHRVATEIDAMPQGTMKHLLVAAAAWLLPTSDAATQGSQRPLAAAPRTVIGMNVPALLHYQSNAPFANLVIGSPWVNKDWAPFAEPYLDKSGNVLSLPPGGVAHRWMLIPPTGPQGIQVRCTFRGSGDLSLFGGGDSIVASRGSLRFHVTNRRGKPERPVLVLKGVDPRDPFRDLDCRDTTAPPEARFRPEFLATLRGYGVLRFMDWQNANENVAVRWTDRHPAGGTRTDRDGAAIEDMMALARQAGADPWFVMPWNADDAYVRGFADLVAAALPLNRKVYVEVGNEVWNTGFAVARQAIAEGRARGLSGDDREAGMRRYAQRTVEVMRIWEVAFRNRQGLVRVLATQHRDISTGRMAISYGEVAGHIDALSTAPYFGQTFGGTTNTRAAVLAQLSSDIPAALDAAVAYRRLATGYGKRYIAYEGGEGLDVPAQRELLDALQHDPAQYDLYRRYLAGWQREVGDVLCLLTSVARPDTGGAWGLQAWEDETPNEAPKLKAVREFTANR